MQMKVDQKNTSILIFTKKKTSLLKLKEGRRKKKEICHCFVIHQIAELNTNLIIDPYVRFLNIEMFYFFFRKDEPISVGLI